MELARPPSTEPRSLILIIPSTTLASRVRQTAPAAADNNKAELTTRARYVRIRDKVERKHTSTPGTCQPTESFNSRDGLISRNGPPRAPPRAQRIFTPLLGRVVGQSLL
ncbi:hypothetical protein PVAG01_00434 [Phlyctema vagabunda]|uniref:Uncharacterized protein n=1 Tax=Phlyctema vagabunda TaxID=108571 RepID=A0ABR4PU80_9HELO